ncbi:MAG: type IV pilus biogenesis/stability protein PilW [Gammaproteobacteria bacterium]|nr:type IV pilus biogenesis/stability protein PilW [Gammaproteobacteria bacterium]
MRKTRLLPFVTAVTACVLAGCVSSGSSVSGEKVSLTQASEYNAELGIEYLRQGSRDLAMQKLQKALQQNSDNAYAYMGLGLLYDSTNDPERADKNYRIALRKAPDNPQIQNNYAVFLCQHGKLQASEKYFIEAAQNPLYPTPEAAYTNAGVCANRVPDITSAANYFRKALDINPNFPEALYQMAQLSFNQKGYLQARAFIQRYTDAVTQPTASALLLGVRIERALGNRQGAADYANKLRTLYPTSNEAQQLNQSYDHAGSTG